MKQLLLIFTLMLSCIAFTSEAAGKSSDKDEPQITFKKKSHDYGTIKEADGAASCEFVFTNTGKAPLVIISATAGCGCTRPSYDDAPIQPGKSSSIKVKYNPKGRPGEFVKNITVKTNDPANKKVVLKISGTVVPKE